ncbi:MAG: hypothetical protein JW811_04900 [Clostridiales bacterium]|nr:hypothetical protein [Clostridiales bacterium]
MSQYVLTPPIRNNAYAGAQNTGRLYVRPNVYLPNSEIDFKTGMLRQSARRVGRTQALRSEAGRLDTEYVKLESMLKARANEKGRRMPLKSAVLLIFAIVMLFSVILLVQQGNIIAKEETVRQMNIKIQATRDEIASISAKIDEASDPVQICYIAARDLDMIPADSAQAIYLTALSTRPSQDPIVVRAGND